MQANNIDYDSNQLKKIVEAAEKYYESGRVGIIVYWDVKLKYCRLDYQAIFDKKPAGNIEIVRIPY